MVDVTRIMETHEILSRNTRHHIFPKKLGGTDHPGNIVILTQHAHNELCKIYCTRKPEMRIPKK